MKVFIDVTSSCRSGQNTGMQRMTRKIFTELSRRVDVVPLCWNQIGRCYQRLGPTELRFLTRPFERHSRASARPESRGQSPLAELRRLLFLRRFPWKTLNKQDVFIAPDILHDSRRRSLPNLIRATKARTVAIFHDITSLRLTSVYNVPRRTPRYRAYIELLAQFDLVICISREAEADLHHFWTKFGCRPAPTLLEPWPIEFDTARAFEMSDPKKLVIYVSSLDPRKNHLTLLAAAEQLWNAGINFELQIIGRATGSSRKIIRQLESLRSHGR